MRIKNNPKRNRIDFVNLQTGRNAFQGISFSWRYLPVYLLMVFVFGFLFLNLFNLQIIEGSQNLKVATRINRSTNMIIPPRGIIYDSNGTKLAYNLPSYSLYVNPSQISETDELPVLENLSAYLEIGEDDIINRYQTAVYDENGNKRKINRVSIVNNLSFDEYLALLTIVPDLPGVYISVEPEREYNYSEYYAHIIGYVGDPTQQDIDNGVYSESRVGKIGIEKSYDNILRGIEGVEITERAVVEDRRRTYVPQNVKYGDNIVLTINHDWQVKLTDIMNAQLIESGAFASAGVIMNSNTGEVKALVSLPSYDNNKFAEGISSSEFQELLNNPKTPLLNRVIGLQLPPGSVWKVIGAAAGLEEGVVTKDTRYMSNRCMDLPGGIKFCEADMGYLGNVNVIDAIQKSSNIYFCNLALDINKQRSGIRTLIDYATRFGLGIRTEIDLPGETTGTMASPELKRKLLNEPWYTGDECNTIIGQGLVTVTPLQMTVATSAIANGGIIVKPHLVSRIESPNGTVLEEHVAVTKGELNISKKTLDIIKEGMRKAAFDGTALGLGNLPGNVIAKTGSADAGEYIQGKYYKGAHSWVVGCFDYEQENYCYTTMQQWGGRGFKTVPIMKKFISCLYNDFADKCEII